MDNEHRQAISELTAIAMDGVADAVDTLTDEADPSEIEAFLSICMSHIETIMMAAGMAACDPLLQHCGEIIEHLGSLHNESRDSLRVHAQSLMEWCRAVLDFADNSEDDIPPAWMLPLSEVHKPVPSGDAHLEDSPSEIEPQALSVIEEDRAGTEAATITSYTVDWESEPSGTSWPRSEDSVDDSDISQNDSGTAIPESQVVPSTAELMADEPMFNAFTETTDDRDCDALDVDETVNGLDEMDQEVDSDEEAFFAIAQQFTASLVELEPWLDLLTAPDSTEADTVAAAQAYVGIVDQVRTASEALGLSGLHMIYEQICQNVEVLASHPSEARALARDVLEAWPALLLAYLEDTFDTSRVLAIAELMCHEAWPHPLDEDEAEGLVTALSPDTGETFAVTQRPTVAQPEDVLLTMTSDVAPSLVEAFLQESPTHAAEFSALITSMGRGQQVFNNLSAAQRIVHSLKGSANLIGVTGIANLTHHVEDILEYLNERHIEPPPPLIHLLQEVADCVEIMFEALQGTAEPPSEARRILQDVFDWANRMDTGQLEAEMAQPAELGTVTHPEWTAPGPLDIVPGADSPVAALTPVAAPEPSTNQAAVHTVDKVLRIPMSTLDELYRTMGEISIALDQLQDRLASIRHQSNALQAQEQSIQQRRFELESYVDIRHVSMTQQQWRPVGGGREAFDPLELNEYDELYSATRSFIETVTDSRRMQQQLRGELSTIERVMGQVQRMKRDMETSVRQMRLEAVGTISARLQRSVRQACNMTGKQATLLVEGEDIMLDSEILNQLADPLMHMLRNAVDHGIEPSERRLVQGKASEGTIRLRFSQEGNAVVATCNDDGGGLDYERIRETAVNKGLLAHSEVLDRQSIARLILTPGFSTRETATQLSGRGVGLDVVHTFISDLNGTMEIGDGETGGCQITLRLPLTLMTSHCLVVSVANQPYAIPTSAIARVLASGIGQFSPMGSEMAFEVEQEIYPSRSLAQVLNLVPANALVSDPGQEPEVILAYSDTGLVALTVDRLLANHHLIIKDLGLYLKTVRGIAGLATLADGTLLPVLDLVELLRTSSHTTAAMSSVDTTIAPLAPVAALQVLIVDDSLSVRESLAQLVEDFGYQPLLAHDGIEAIDVLRSQSPDIVLTDLEMPRMNGLELVSYIRTNYSRELPVVIITSRMTQKHRQLAMEAGASLYVTKPYAEDELLSSIQSLLNSGG